jgi:hypothetical protein
MERTAIWVFAGLLAYVCFVLTSINGKMDEFNASNLQYAALSDYGRERPAVRRGEQIVMSHQTQSSLTPTHVGLALIAMISVFVSWHLSRIYHAHEWTKTVLRKNYAPYAEPYHMTEPREALHGDQDCVGDPPRPDGRIKDSWLPHYVTRLDGSRRDAQSEPARDIAPVRSHGGRI